MNNSKVLVTPRTVIQLLFFLVLLPILPMLIAWRWDWFEAWAYAILTLLSFIISRLLAARRHPDLIAERSRFMQHEDAKDWDKKLVPWMGLWGIPSMVVIGLDELLGWSPPFSPPVRVTGFLLILCGYALSAYALVENRFFSGMVRLQTERGQHVISSGPYRWLRHPGYAGGLLTFLGTPLLLDSSWAFIPTIITIGLYVLRTSLEDRTLQNELPGYAEYARRVKYRLFPGIW